METTKNTYPDEVISAGQLLRILDSDAREISTLCQRACLKPKKDGFGNIYFSKGDVDVLRKVKELYEHTRKVQDAKIETASSPVKENKLKNYKKERRDLKDLEIKAESFLNNQVPAKIEATRSLIPSDSQSSNVIRKLDNLETNVVNKIKDVLSEKLDGLDEVIVELIKAKTENESLRQKVNDLNKENFALKSENASYKPVGLGLYVKKATDEFAF